MENDNISPGLRITYFVMEVLRNNKQKNDCLIEIFKNSLKNSTKIFRRNFRGLLTVVLNVKIRH